MGSCCCCCSDSLYRVTNVAVVYTVVNFIFFLFLDVFLIVVMQFPSVFTTGNSSDAFLLLVRGFQELKSVNVLWILLAIRVILRLLWILATPSLFIGNRLDKRRYMSAWQVMAAALILYAALASAYFLIVHYECGFIADIGRHMAVLSKAGREASEKKIDSIPTTAEFSETSRESAREVARFILFLTLFEGVILFFIPNVLFLICVHLRSTQLKYSKKESRLIESWTSYELQPFRIPRAQLPPLPPPPPPPPPMMMTSSLPRPTGRSSDHTSGISTLSRGLPPGVTSVRLPHARNSAPVQLPSISQAVLSNSLSRGQYLYENHAFDSESEEENGSRSQVPSHRPEKDASHHQQQPQPPPPQVHQDHQPPPPQQQQSSSSSFQSSTLKRVYL